MGGRHKGRTRGHRTEARTVSRELMETFCAEPRCRFYGKKAVQGVCHTYPDTVEREYLERKSRDADELISECRAIAKHQKLSQKNYVKYLEDTIRCNWMNAEFTLDELVRLRGQYAVARDEVARLTRRSQRGKAKP